ncbi:MAG: PIG-L deacetylase family protein [Halioglobus sp.]
MLRRIKQSLYRLLALSAIRVPATVLMKVASTNEVPALGPVPAADTVVVLAPHMDDETIGCGGAIAAHVRAGAKVHVIFLTDGVKGFEPQELRQVSFEVRRETRVRESEAACEILGVAQAHYLNMPDGESKPSNEAAQRLLATLEAINPDLAYLPFLTDTHHDHQTCIRLFLDACSKKPVFDSLLCNCYEVWTPLHPNQILDITEDMPQKMAALACYDSQLKMNDYLSSVKGLNAYRAIANRSQGYAEAFYLTTVARYRQLMDQR